jgi:hypothetical protein
VIAAHPPVEQRCHWYAKLTGESVHVPGVAVKVAPTFALPETVGLEVLVGTPTTVAVGDELCEAEPAALLADTVTASWAPRSAAVAV